MTQPSPDADLRRLVAALHYAATHPRPQGRQDRDGAPCINRSIALLHILAVEAGVTDTDVLCAAVLHDAVHGAGEAERAQRAAEIDAMFGSEVLAIVEDVAETTSAENAKPPLHGAKLVKLADQTATLRDIARAPPASWPLQRRREFFDWARAVVEAIGPAHAGLRKLFEQASAARP
jgi:guanosine-3',5'-bis(diphosphate) 3'-pyrophosphohydrolase